MSGIDYRHKWQKCRFFIEIRLLSLLFGKTNSKFGLGMAENGIGKLHGVFTAWWFPQGKAFPLHIDPCDCPKLEFDLDWLYTQMGILHGFYGPKTMMRGRLQIAIYSDGWH